MRVSAALSHPGAQKSHNAAARARALFWAANLAYLQSDYPATRSLCEESLAVWQQQGLSDRSWVAQVLSLLGEVATEEGDYTTAPMLFEEALAIWRELKDTRGLGNGLIQLGWSDMRSGNYVQAAARLEEALIFCREAGYMTNVAFALAGLGEVAVRQGQYERSAHLLEESLLLRRERGDKWGIGTSLGTLGWVALRQGDFKRMRALLGESLAVRMDIGDRSGIAWCLEKLAEAIMLEVEATPSARRAVWLEQAASILGVAAALRAPVRSMIDPADQPEYERMLMALRAVLGETVFAACWKEGSMMTMQQAVDYALHEPEMPAEVTLPLSAQAVKERFGGLTEREREVAALIAQGRTNREIAEALVVGVKTAETYVTRILNKLGFDSRVQIATWAMEKGLAPPAHAPKP